MWGNATQLVLYSGFHAMDSGFHVLDSGSFDTGTWIPDSNRWWDYGFLELYFGFQNPGFQIPQAKISRIPEPGILYMGWMKTWGPDDLVFVDCEQSLFFSDLVREVQVRASGDRREKRGRQPEKKNEHLSSRAFSHGRGHLRVSRVLIDGTRKKGDYS